MLKLQERRDLADKLLAWLKANNIKRWSNNHDTFSKFAEEAEEHIYLYDVWKAYELLRNTGRIGLNSANGRKGGYVISFVPISKPVGRVIDVHKIKATMLKAILKDLRSQFASEWNEVIGELDC